MALADLLWTEDDMEHFLRTVASLETHKACWKQKRQDRKDENHKDVGKPMPRMFPPSFVRLFQFALAQVHSKKFMQHFGFATIEHILHTPIQVLAERKGVAVSAAVATDFQINLFTEGIRAAFDNITSTLDTAEVVAIVQQATPLFSGSAMDNIRYGRIGANDADVIAAAKAAHAHDFIKKLPDGYQTDLGERATTLSGGQRQRIAIARAVLRDAPILLLDEATSALDDATERLIAAHIHSLNTTVIVVTHREPSIWQPTIEFNIQNQTVSHRIHNVQSNARKVMPTPI